MQGSHRGRDIGEIRRPSIPSRDAFQYTNTHPIDRPLMINIIGISGSLRHGSYNYALLRTAAGLMPAQSQLTLATIRGIPLYDGDVEANEGIPAPVTALKDAIAAADGLLLATPEYNNSIPGVFKSAIDWLSRPPGDIKRVIAGRPVALIGASPGGFGTEHKQSAKLPVLRTLGMALWTESRLLVSRANTEIAEDGKLTDAKLREQVQQFLAGFVAYVQASRRGGGGGGGGGGGEERGREG